MSTAADRAESLRRYADAPCPRCHGKKTLRVSGTAWMDCGDCGGTGLDPRFAALRGEHEWWFPKYRSGLSTELAYCPHCEAQQYPVGGPPPYCLRSDVGSVLRAAAACGSDVLAKVLSAIADAFWWPAAEDFQMRERESPEDAAARAFVAAVPEPAS